MKEALGLFLFNLILLLKKSTPKVTEPRAKAKTNMLQVLGSGHQINGMLKYFSFLKTCDFVSARFVDKIKFGMQN